MKMITAARVTRVCKRYQEKRGYNNSLHIYLNNANMEKEHLQFCIEKAQESKDYTGTRLAKILLKLSKTQLRKIYNNLRLEIKYERV